MSDRKTVLRSGRVTGACFKGVPAWLWWRERIINGEKEKTLEIPYSLLEHLGITTDIDMRYENIPHPRGGHFPSGAKKTKCLKRVTGNLYWRDDHANAHA